MPTARALILLLAAAGDPTPPGVRSYLKAREVLDAGVEAIGGPDALREVRTVRRVLSGEWVDTGQSPRPCLERDGCDTRHPPGHERDEVMSFVDYSAGRWIESLQYAQVADPTEYAVQTDVVTPDQGFQGLAYMQERPFLRRHAAADLPALRAGMLRRFPEGILRTALDRPETLEWNGVAADPEGPHEVISFADATGVRVRLYFDQATHLLAKAETLRDHPIAGDTSSERLFADYGRVGRLRLPFRYVDRLAGVPTQHLTAGSIALNASAPEDRFRPPRDFVPIEDDPAEPTLEKLANDLYLIRGSHNVLIAVLRDQVVVLEAPVGSAHAERCLELARSVAPGKPIRLVSTHFHFDHVAGVRTYVARGVPILTTADAKPVIERAAAGRHTMHSDALTRNPRAPVIEVASAREVIGDGAHRLELYDFGPTRHVAQLLVAYFPRERLLYQADLWDCPSPELAVGGADTALLAGKIEALGLKVERIVPAHGIPATIALLNDALAVRAKYRPAGRRLEKEGPGRTHPGPD